jgi:hypothetical protein
VPFNVDVPGPEQAYLGGVGLSAEATDRISRFIAEDIANVPDSFRLDPANRPNPGSPHFQMTYLIWDHWGDGRIHKFDFHIRDDAVAFGVLLIVFINHHERQSRSGARR